MGSLATLALGLLASGPTLAPRWVAVHLSQAPELRPAVERGVAELGVELGRSTRWALRAAPELGLDPNRLARCNEAVSFVCWVRAAGQPSGAVAAVGEAPERVLAVSARVGEGGKEAVALLLVPLSPTHQAIAAEGGETAEARIFADVVAIDRELLLDDLEAWRALARDLRAALGARAPDEEVGALVVSAPLGGLEVELDGAPVGRTDPEGALELLRVRAGAHALRLVDPSGAHVHTPEPVRVEPGTLLHHRASLEDAPPPLTPIAGGLGLAAIGVAFTVYALAAPSNASLCRGDLSCGGGGFVTFGEGDGFGSGVPIAPLGYGLALAGGAWASSAWLLPREERWTWIALAASLALGGAAFAISTAAGG